MNLENTLWLTGLVLHLVLLFVLAVRGRWRRFPIFTVLIVFYTFRDIISHLPGLRNMDPVVFMNVFFWGFQFTDLLLRFAVLAELLRVAFRNTSVSPGRLVAWSAMVVALCAGLAVLVTGTYGVRPLGMGSQLLMSALVTVGNLLMLLLPLATLLALVVTSRFTGLGWRSHVRSIAQGFGFFALVGLGVQVARFVHASAGHGQGARSSALTLALTLVAGYMCAVVYWIVGLWLEEPQAQPGAEPALEFELPA